jgi:glycosyltransferase involved in cell wall biosynthesis
VTRCGSLGFTGTSQYSEAHGEMFGANVAEVHLTQALLEEAPELQWDLWSSEVFPSLTKTHELRSHPPDIRHLRLQYGQRVNIRSLAMLQEVAIERRYVFLSNTSMFSRISDVRSQIGATHMPICALTHSLYAKEFMFGYGWLLLSARPHDVIVASSEAGRRTLEKLFATAAERISDRIAGAADQLPIPRIVQIPFGTAIPREAELDREHARLLLKIPATAFVIVYFGRITEEYKADLDPLLQATQHLRVCGHNAWLVLAGQTSDRTYMLHLDQRLSALGLRDKSICIENCPEFLKTSVYAACDVAVSPADSIQETFGLSILEAMAHSRPVIASSWSGYRELVEDGITGFLIRTTWTPEASNAASIMAPIALSLTTAHYLAQRTFIDCGQLIDKLTMLVEQPGLGILMGKTGRARVEAQYAWPLIARRFLTLWEEQFELALAARDRPRVASLEHFSHYADSVLSPADILCRIHGTDCNDTSVLNSFEFHHEHARSQIRLLLEITSARPVPVGELCQDGFDLDCILWLAKKGLCRIVRVPE